MTIVVVGGGGREHAIIQKLRENPVVTEVYALPGNGGISFDATCVPIKATDLDQVVTFCREKRPDLVVVAPDDPLVLGLVDRLEAAGIRAFGPNAAAARIEGSKVFSKNLMKKYGIPTARYEVFDDPHAALQYIRQTNTYPIVIKADGLALGKGVLIPTSYEEAADAIRSIMEDKVFGASGNRVVVEEFLEGPEVSVLAFTDGETVAPMVSSMDHKRALDGDKGLNTGGMGTVAPNPYYSDAVAQVCMDKIFLPTLRAMQTEGCPFKGCLYFGLMLTKGGPKVIEYNCRFGDPETQVVLPLMESDLLTVMNATIDGTLRDTPVTFRDEAACCVVLASGGYPQKYETGKPITGLTDGGLPGARVYHAGTRREGDTLLTAGGRVLGVTATAPTLREAVDRAYAASEKIAFDGLHKRTDIGARALAAAKAEPEDGAAARQ